MNTRAVVSALIVLAVAGAVPPKAAAEVVVVTAPMAGENGRAALRMSMRRLWAEHAIWTRAFIVSTVAGTPDAPAAKARLLRNQEDIGAAFVPYYGQEAGTKLAALLKDHSLIAGEVIKHAKKPKGDRFLDADKRWHENSAEIAGLLGTINPNWSKDEFAALFDEHLELTAKDASFRFRRNWAADVSAFDELYQQALLLGERLADGIIKQFPEKI